MMKGMSGQDRSKLRPVARPITTEDIFDVMRGYEERFDRLERIQTRLPKLPSAMLTKTAWSVAFNSFVTVDFAGGSVTWDVYGDAAEISNDGIRIKRTGVWAMTCATRWGADGVGFRIMSMGVNGVGFIGDGKQIPNLNGFFGPADSHTVQRKLTANDLITMNVWQNGAGGVAQNVDATLACTFLSET